MRTEDTWSSHFKNYYLSAALMFKLKCLELRSEESDLEQRRIMTENSVKLQDDENICVRISIQYVYLFNTYIYIIRLYI